MSEKRFTLEFEESPSVWIIVDDDGSDFCEIDCAEGIDGAGQLAENLCALLNRHQEEIEHRKAFE